MSPTRHRGGEGVRPGAVVRGIGSTLVTVAGALALGFGVPLFWTWGVSTIAGSSPRASGSLWVIAFGIILTYWLLLVVASRVRGRWEWDWMPPAARRQSWNRSMSDEPLRRGSGKSDPVERMFILGATLGFFAFVIWAAFFGGTPCSGPCGTVG